MPSLYSTSGMGQSPMFINFRPFNLDFSRVRANRAEQFRLREELTKRNNELRSKARDMKLPEMQGVPNDVAEDTAVALEGQRMMVDVLNKYPNANYAVQTDEWKKATQLVQTPYQPDAVAARAARLKGVDSLRDTMEAKKNDPIGGNPFTQGGRMVPDPQDPTKFLSIADAFDRRSNDPHYTRTAKDRNYQLENTFTSTINDFDKNMVERMRTTASNSLKRPINEILDPASRDQSLAQLAAQPDAPPELQFAFLVNGAQSHQSNSKQIQAGLENVMSTLNDNDLYNIFQGYSGTKEFQKSVENGDFLKDGVIDQNAVYEKMLGGKEFDTGLDLPGGKMKGSFAAMYLTNVANRFLSNSNETSLNYSMLRDRKSGAGSENANKVPDFYAYKLGLPGNFKVNTDGKGVTMDVAGSGFTKTPMPAIVAGKSKDGKTQFKQITVDAINIIPDGTRIDLERKKLGLPANFGVDPKHIYQTVSESVLQNEELWSRGGKIFNGGEFDNWKVVEASPTFQIRPNVFNPASMNPDLLRAGAVQGFEKATMDSNGNQLISKINPEAAAAPNGNGYPDVWQEVTLMGTKDEASEINDFVPEGFTNQPFKARGSFWNAVGPQALYGPARASQDSLMNAYDPGAVNLIQQESTLKEIPITNDAYLEHSGSGVKIEEIDGSGGWLPDEDQVMIKVWRRVGASSLLDQKNMINRSFLAPFSTERPTERKEYQPNSGFQQSVIDSLATPR